MGDRLQNACCQQMGGRRDWVASGAGGLHKQLNFVLIFQFILSRANHVFFLFCFDHNFSKSTRIDLRFSASVDLKLLFLKFESRFCT